MSSSFSDWQTIKFRNVNGTELPETIEKVKFSGISWMLDGSGIFYSAFRDIEGDGTETTSMSYQVAFFHKMGTDQSEDVEVVSFPTGLRKFSVFWILNFYLAIEFHKTASYRYVT